MSNEPNETAMSTPVSATGEAVGTDAAAHEAAKALRLGAGGSIPQPGQVRTMNPGLAGTPYGHKKQMPSVGRIVYYTAYGTPGGEFKPGETRAAIITVVDDPIDPESSLGLCVINPIGIFFNSHTPYHPGRQPGTWRWPEYTPPALVVDPASLEDLEEEEEESDASEA
jgi:hypothetical protein